MGELMRAIYSAINSQIRIQYFFNNFRNFKHHFFYYNFITLHLIHPPFFPQCSAS